MYKKGFVVNKVIGLIIFLILLVVVLLIIFGTGDILDNFIDKFGIGTFKELFS